MVLRDFTIVAVDSDMLAIFVIVGSNTLRQPIQTVDEIGSNLNNWQRVYQQTQQLI